ncbi:hypothetical protein [Planomonospora sp. ID67723]|nr:hypothetical protein [Planomonospora sp. ID67723]
MAFSDRQYEIYLNGLAGLRPPCPADTSVPDTSVPDTSALEPA